MIATNGGEPSAFAAKKATSTILIVSVVGQDPVATGLVASFARPSGNLTGFTILNEELIVKRLERHFTVIKAMVDSLAENLITDRRQDYVRTVERLVRAAQSTQNGGGRT